MREKTQCLRMLGLFFIVRTVRFGALSFFLLYSNDKSGTDFSPFEGNTDGLKSVLLIKEILKTSDPAQVSDENSNSVYASASRYLLW